MTKDWVDFAVVKAAVTMQMVLDHYSVTVLKRVGGELRGPCPIHRGTASSKHLSVNLNKNAFKCFSQGCGARGNVLDFVAAMEKCSVRDAALKLQDWFKIGESQSSEPDESVNNETGIEVGRGIYSDEDGGLFEVITMATSTEDSEPLVIYRELFGEYRFWVASTQNFAADESRFTLVKAL